MDKNKIIIENEKKKYEMIYTNNGKMYSPSKRKNGVHNPERKRKSYGHGNRGKYILYKVCGLNIKSLIDVGCGYNEFCDSVKQINNIKCVGVDFACPGADIICSAHDIPFKDNEFDMLTSFDMLEHIPVDCVDDTLKEFKRIANRFIFNISYEQSKTTINEEHLHMTVRPEDWWINKITDIFIKNGDNSNISILKYGITDKNNNIKWKKNKYTEGFLYVC